MPSSEADRAEPAEIARAVDHLAGDGLVAFPTETTWGLAAASSSLRAVERLRSFKGRDPSQPISVLVSSPAVLERIGCEVSPVARAWIEALWPGPLTLVLPCSNDSVAAGVRNGDGGLGIRCSPHPVAGALARAAEARGLGPLTATSCNESGSPPARIRAEARDVCGAAAGAPQLVESGADAGGDAPSTVVDLAGSVGRFRVLREGAISKQRLREILDERGVGRAPDESL